MRLAPMLPALVLALASGLSALQTPAAPGGGPRFDAVSVKPAAPDVRGGSWSDRLQNGRWVVRGAVPLAVILTVAFGVNSGQLASVPDWANRTLFTIDARADGDYTQDQFRQMVCNMLADRFKLAYHIDTQPIEVNILTVAKGGAKLKPTSAPCVKVAPGQQAPEGQTPCGMSVKNTLLEKPSPDNGGAGWMQRVVSGYSATMADLAAYIPIRLQGQIPVVDQTGLTGAYDMTLSYPLTMLISTANSPLPTPDANAPPPITFADAMKSAWGLVLTQKKLPMPVYVIDHLEMPTPD